MDEVQKAEEQFKKGSSKTKKIVIILAIIVVALVIVVGAYFLLNSPKKAFDKNMEKVSKLIENELLGSISNTEFVYDKNKVLEADMKLYGEVTTGSDSYYVDEVKEINDLIKNVKLDIKEKIDIKNESIYAYLGLEENNKAAISGEAFLNRDIIIGRLQDISENYFYAKTDDIGEEVKQAIDSVFKILSNNNDETIAKEYIDVIKKSISDNQYKVEDATIKINGNDTKVKKTSLVITENEIKLMVKNVLEKLKTDDRMLDPIITSMGTSYYTVEEMKEQIVKSFDQLIKEIDDIEIDVDFIINTYTKGNEIVQFEIEFTMAVEGENVTASIVMNCADKNNVNILFKIKYGGISYEFTLDIVKEGNKTTVTLDFGNIIGMKVVYETVKVNDSRVESKIEVMQEWQKLITLRCNTDYYANTKEEVNRKDEFIVDLMPSRYEEDKINAKLTVETHLFYTDEIRIPAPGRNDVDIINGEIPYEFLEKLEKRLNEIQIIKDIVTMYNSSLSSSSPVYEDNYDYDDYYNYINQYDFNNYDVNDYFNYINAYNSL